MPEERVAATNAAWMSDPAYVARQYEKEDRLATRASVWVVEDDHPTDIAVAAIAGEKPQRVLEIGCGQGALAERLASETRARVVAADISPRMVELTAARGVEAVVADVQALPFPDGEFDCVVAAWMLYHVPNLSHAISELARVTRPGGLLVAITNGDGHLSELWALAGRKPITLSFSRANGAAHLRPHFRNVEQHDLPARALFPDRATAARYVLSVHDGQELATRLPASMPPLEAHGEPTVFVARR